MDVQGKVIVVTGGGNGIGQQLVLTLLDKGATVAAADINADALEQTRRLAGDRAGMLSLHQTDIASREAVARLVETVLARHGCVDAIINNAGVIHPFRTVRELDHGVIERMININFYGVINMTKAFLPLLLARPVAHIVNVSSMGGIFAYPKQTFYGASKAAVKLLSEGLYVELRGSRVGVTVVYPGAIATNITRNNDAHNDAIERFSRIYRGTPPATAARRIVEAIESNRFRVVIGIDAKVLSFLYRLFPRLTIVLVGKAMNIAMPDE